MRSTNHPSWMERLLDTSSPGTRNPEFRADQLALFCRGDVELMSYTLGRFLEEVPPLLVSLRSHLDDEDWEGLLGRVHALREACQVIGAYPMAQACLRFEHRHAVLAEEGDTLLLEAVEEFQRLRSSLRAYLQRVA
jgi:HPt (histidine-containing phosphotransfer) domain-containing protein